MSRSPFSNAWIAVVPSVQCQCVRCVSGACGKLTKGLDSDIHLGLGGMRDGIGTELNVRAEVQVSMTGCECDA